LSADLTGVTVLMSIPPTPNGPLHVGHMSGPYLALDIAARAARSRNERVLSVCGLDPHQNYVLAKAELEGRSSDEVLADYGDRIRTAYQRAGVGFDVFAEPWTDAAYRTGVVRLLRELVDRGAVTVTETEYLVCENCDTTLHHAYVAGSCGHCGRPSNGGTCEACGALTTAATMGGATCTRCGGGPKAARAALPVLSLERYRAELSAAWSGMEMSARVRRLVHHYESTGLPDLVMAYPTDWGLPTDEVAPGTRLDVWLEMGLGYLWSVARAVDPNAEGLDACVAAWRSVAEFWFFLGIDNAFYTTVSMPATFLAAGMAPDRVRGSVVNEFYRLDGLKFSTSRNHAVWVDEFLAETDPAMLRLFLSWDRPDRSETSFSRVAYEAFAARVRAALDRPAGAAGEAGVLADIEIERAEAALRLPGLDPALAVRSLLAALDAGHPRARALLEVVAGAPLGAPVPA